MTKDELISAIAAGAGLTKAQARDALAALTVTITGQVASGDTVRIGGFGQFKPRTSKARTGMNPQTGDAVEIPARTFIGFKASRKTAE